MKKLLIATAALAMVAGTAQAQSSVTVYGIIDTGYNNVENTTSAGVKTETTAVTTNGEAATSRFGLRGTEDLGGGQKANFVIETTIGQAGMATGTVVGNRLFYAGLEDAKMGEVRIGLQNTFNRDVFLGFDQLAANNVIGNLAHSNAGVANGTTATDPVAGPASGSHTVSNTAINYMSPSFSGVRVMLGMTQNDTEGTAKAKNGTGSQAGLTYKQGKFDAAVAYSEATVDAPLTGAALTGNTKTKNTSAAASYDFSVAKVAYIYNKREGNNPFTANDIANIDRTSHSFSASIPLSAKLVGRVGYGFGEMRQGQASNYNGDLKGMQAGLNYNLSKRTMVYGIYGDESREVTATTKAKTKEYSVGVRHSF
jgi:predicted porin